VAAFRGLPGSASYSASKAAIATYTDALRAELHGTPIKVTRCIPWNVLSRILRILPTSQIAKMATNNP
jgi:short-subunit dehydrogenase